MKKVIVIILCVAFVLSAFACSNRKGGDSETSDPDSVVSPIQETDIQTLISSLGGNEFKDAALSGSNFGTENPADVGVDKTAFYSDEEMYPVPDDSAFDSDAIFVIAEGGGAQAVADAVSAAKAVNENGKKVKIKFPKGEYYVDANEVNTDAVITLDGFDGIYVEGDETLITTDCHFVRWVGGITVTNSKNVHFNGLAFDFINANALSGEITKIDTVNNKITFIADDEYTETLAALNEKTTDIDAYLEIDKYTLAPRENGNWTQPGTSNQCPTGMTVKGKEVTVSFASAMTLTDAPKGTRAVVYIYTYKHNTVILQDSEDLYFEHFAIYMSTCMAFTPARCKNIYLNKFSIENKPGTQRYFTSTSDGWHSINIRGDIIITNSLFEYSFDDALNLVSGFYMTVSKVSPLDDEITISRYNSSNTVPLKGDILEFYESSLERVATLEVIEATQSGSMFICKVKGNYNAVKSGMYCSNVSATAHVEFKNNIIRNKRNRGILIQVRDSIFENNTFKNVAHGALMIHSEIVNNYFESIMPRNITIKSNKFINDSYYSKGSDINVFVYGRTGLFGSADCITGMKIENNYFGNLFGSALLLGSSSKTSIKNNLFYDCPRSSTASNDCTVILNNCDEVEVTGNYNLFDLKRESYSPVKTAGNTNPKNIPLGDNVNFAYETVVSDIEVKNIPQITSEIKIDGNLSDWEGVGTELELLGSELSSGVVYSGYEDYFNVNMLKIGWTDNGIYVAFDVKDDQIICKKESDFWSGDCVEMFLTTQFEIPNADIALQKENGATFQTAFAPTDWESTLATVRSSGNIRFRDWSIIVKKTEQGYCGEAFIPFAACFDLKDYIDRGEEIAICFCFIDAPRTGTVYRIMVATCNNNSIETNKYNNSKMPRYIFVNK